MENEFLHLRLTASTLSIGALKCAAHLLPLLRPLRFTINAYNKYVTSDLVIIIRNDDPSLFFETSTAPVHILVYGTR